MAQQKQSVGGSDMDPFIKKWIEYQQQIKYINDKYEYDMQALRHQYGIDTSGITQAFVSKNINIDECNGEIRDWFYMMVSCCKQADGAAGHRVHWSKIPEFIPHAISDKFKWGVPHHWICPAEHYEILKLSPPTYIYSLLMGYNITIDKECLKQLWGN